MRKLAILLCLLGAQITSVVYALSFPSLPPFFDCPLLVFRTWVAPANARACMYGISFEDGNRKNVLEVITKTLAFHASTNYQVHAPKPFDKDIEWDLLTSLEEMKERPYKSDFEFHQDVRKSIMKVKDGHLMYTNGCYDNVYTTYNPFPLVLLTSPPNGSQAIHIAPNAYEIVSSLFGDDIKFWEKRLGKPLSRFNGARVIKIDKKDPFSVVDDNSEVTGVFQGLSSRQNSFFSTAVRRYDDWSYRLGDFAERPLPLVDSVDLIVQRVGIDTEEKITVPYRSRYNGEKNVLQRLAYKHAFCRPIEGTTNGRDLSQKSSQGPKRGTPRVKGILPTSLKPRLVPMEESVGSTQFYTLDETIGVLAMGDFGGNENKQDDKKDDVNCRLFKGLRRMNETGIDKLIIDLTDNAGGYNCVASFLHHLLFGHSNNTDPQPGLDTMLRMPPIAQKIIKAAPKIPGPPVIVYQQDWHDAQHRKIGGQTWFKPITNITINGRQDFFSQRLGVDCPISKVCKGEKILGPHPLFRPENIILLSDGRCGSACAVFSVLLAKKYNVTTVVVGGKSGVEQQYCGFVGGETVSFKDIDNALKTTKLKKQTGKINDVDIPPDFIVNGGLTITWRLAYGVDNPNEPEEWQNHTASDALPLTAGMAHNPQAIWEAAARKFFPFKPRPQPEPQPILQVQLP